MPARLLHPCPHLRQLLQPRVDLGAGQGDILEMTVVEPVQGDAGGVTLVAGDYRSKEAVHHATPARQ